jgi:phosphoribosyl-ATP pyrophosphohydrolase
MTPLEEAIEALKAANEAKDAAMQRAIADVNYQFANIIRVRTMEYEDELKRELHRR